MAAAPPNAGDLVVLPPPILLPRLTPAQHRVLDVIRDIGVDGWPVGVRDVMKVSGVASTSTAYAHILALERKGYLARNPRGDGWRAVR